ncbi:hypothetical protein IG631_13888 [Alternaria alternata]|nr:hypothetical protein IG631_13888 [Alternaria alternata]
MQKCVSCCVCDCGCGCDECHDCQNPVRPSGDGRVHVSVISHLRYLGWLKDDGLLSDLPTLPVLCNMCASGCIEMLPKWIVIRRAAPPRIYGPSFRGLRCNEGDHVH